LDRTQQLPDHIEFLNPEISPMIRDYLLAVPIARLSVGRIGLALAIGLSAMSAAPVRADNLDVALLEHAHEVISYLHEHHHRNVGVLKFRIHKGKQPTSFTVGPLNDNIVERLENALIAKNSVEPAQTIGVIHNANAVAVARKIGRYDNPVAQRALFQQSYPLAWGNTTVKPDYLLTGVISVGPDLKSATVTIEGFGPNSPKQDKVAWFQVQTDRSLLSDLNQSFQVKSRQLGKRKIRNIDLDEEAVSDAAEDNSKSSQNQPATTSTNAAQPGSSSAAQPSADNPLYYEIRYDGQPQPITTDPNSPGELQVAEPNENQVISFYLKSQATERIGVALTVNGKSTLYEQEGDPNHLLAWVIDPGREYVISGYQLDNNTRKPFRVLSDAETAAVTYGPNLGLIHFHIFRSGGSSSSTDIAGGDNAAKDDPSATAMNISLRGLSRSALVSAGKTRSLADLKKAVQKHAHVRPRTRNPIDADSNAVEGAIQNDAVQNPVLVQTIVVRYYKPNRQ
jgi:hypothetical protein